MRRRRVDGDEQDLFSRYWRRVTPWQRGEKRLIKRRANKRYRREGLVEARREMSA